jgi:hypothetical protein
LTGLPLTLSVTGIFSGTAATRLAGAAVPECVIFLLRLLYRLGMSYQRVSTMTFTGPLVVRKRPDFSSLDSELVYNQLRRRRFKERERYANPGVRLHL